MVDSADDFGGHTASHVFPGGWVFDEGPHISFTSEQRLADLLAANVDQQFESFSATVNNYWKGYWIKHPAQCNLHGLPTDLVTRVLLDFVTASQQPERPVANYEEWLRASYGNAFAETFPMEYTVKYHTTTAANLDTSWIGPRLYRPSLAEVFRGALEPATPNVHYVTKFRYPSHGGFVSYLEPFRRMADVRLGHGVQRIDRKGKVVHFSTGASAKYRALISSVPLPELIPLIDDCPADVREAAARLACSEVVVVCLGIDRPDFLDAHWSYFYDRDVFYTRLSTPHLQSPHNVPPGCGSLQAECYYSSKYRPLDRRPEDCIDPVIADLRRTGVLREDDRILFRHALHIKYANVMFDLETARSVATVQGWLEDVGIHYCGRYGDWAYIWTDQAFFSGERAAQAVIDGRRPGR
ncbi:MAG: FAD-dependent oxidoreductase [Gemmatimonadales bacterium]